MTLIIRRNAKTEESDAQEWEGKRERWDSRRCTERHISPYRLLLLLSMHRRGACPVMQCFYRAIFIFQTSMISEGRRYPAPICFRSNTGSSTPVAIVATAS